MQQHLDQIAPRDTLLSALRADDPKLNRALRNSARHIADEVFGREIFLRGLLEISNLCARDCLYCGLRAGNHALKRYRMTADEILVRAHAAQAAGLPTVVLQSGEGTYSAEELCDIVRRIKSETDRVVTLSCGEFSRDDYGRLRDAGADRYLLRHETADPELYARLHPGYDAEGRLRCLDFLAEFDYEVGSGFMIGLPGQTEESMLRDIEVLLERRVHMAGVGPFIANPDTPLADSANGNVEVVLNVVALLRHALPGCNLPATTALDTLSKTGREEGIEAGANVVMPGLTPAANRELYAIYPNKRCKSEDSAVCIPCTRARLAANGYQISHTKGWSQTPNHAPREFRPAQAVSA
ncbi:MAG: [FeFe] hydrogenase H-cluster radical SAM maturase HydE [Verrucomicrobiota bacterium]